MFRRSRPVTHRAPLTFLATAGCSNHPMVGSVRRPSLTMWCNNNVSATQLQRRCCASFAPENRAFYEEVELLRHGGEQTYLKNIEGGKVPLEGMSVELYKFQKAGVEWMLEREATSQGGIMADHLGMGKTVQMLGLCALSKVRRDANVKAGIRPVAATLPLNMPSRPASRLRPAPAPAKGTQDTSAGRMKKKTVLQSDMTTTFTIDPRDSTLGPKLLFVIRQMQRIGVLGNCSTIVRPGKELFALHDDVETTMKQDKKPDFTSELAEVEKWLKFSKTYHPAFERHARWFMSTESTRRERSHDNDSSQRIVDLEMLGKSPEIRTLIVVPASLMLQWNEEIQNKVAGSRTVHIFHGATRNIDPAELEVMDFVITTYDTLTQQLPQTVRDRHRKKGTALADWTAADEDSLAGAGPLFGVHWKRIILDEGHVIRHKSTLRWKAVRALQGSKRWVMTATPVHNSIEDLQTLLEFIHAPPLPLIHTDNKTLVMDAHMQRIVARTLQPLFMRRAPIMHINGRSVELVKLPKITEKVVHLDLSNHEADIYNKLLASKRASIAKLGQGERATNKAMHIFALMTMLRQVCCHHWLANHSNVKLYKCNLCSKEAVDPVVVPCGHAFCRECLHNYFHEQTGDSHELAARALCPACEAPIQRSALKGHVMTSKEHISILKSRSPFEMSTKVSRLIQDIKQLAKQKPDDKMVIFSHFTKFLDVISVALDTEEIGYARIDGTMTLRDRNTIIAGFKRPTDTRVLLASKTASGVGLNLTMANHVVVVDPWWNPAIEDQAVHRCHRIGQVKDVNVQRYVVKDTIEAYCHEVSQKKKDFGKAVLHAATASSEGKQMKVVSRLEQVVNNLSFLGEKK